MTREELEKIPFTCVCSASFADEHCLTYVNKDYDFGMCKHTKKKKDGFTFGRSYTHYRYRNQYYNTLDKFLDAIKDIPFIMPTEVTESGCTIIDIRTKKGVKL